MDEQKFLITRIVGEQLFNHSSDAVQYGNLESLISEAENQSVFPIVFSAIDKSKLTKEQSDRYDRKNLQYKAQNIRNLQTHIAVHQILSSQNIDYSILKGQASARYYPNPLLRTMGDVDFIVRENDIDKADALLQDYGFEKIKNAEKHEYHWAYKKGKDSVELHWSVPGLPNDDKVKSYFDDLIAKRQTTSLDNGTIFVPSDFHHGLVLLLHTISHMTGTGVGIRHICDWLVFQNSMSEEDFVRIFEQPLKNTGLWRFAQVLSQIGVLYFTCKNQKWCSDADDSICKVFLEDVLQGGNFGIKDDTRKSQAKLIQNKRSKKVEKGHMWKNGLISINEKAKTDFSFCGKVILLRPLGWIIVCFQYLFRVVTGKRNNVFSRDIYTDASNRQKLYAELKLFERE